MNPRVWVIFRNDDPSALSDPAHERRMLELFERHRIPQVLAVVPRMVEDPHDHRPTACHPLDENPAMVQLLREYHARGLIEIAQHGLTHQTNSHRPSRFQDPASFPRGVVPFRGVNGWWLPYEPAHPDGYSEFNGLPVPVQRARILEGKRELESLLGIELESFVFPWNSLNRPCLEVVRGAGFRFVSCEDSEHVVEGLQIIGCYFWNIDVYMRELAAALTCRKPALLQLVYHSWMVTPEQSRTLEEVLSVVAREPRVTCITPRQLPEALPGVAEILRLRADAVRLSDRINRYVAIPPGEERNHYYVLDRAQSLERVRRLRRTLILSGFFRSRWTLRVSSAAVVVAVVSSALRYIEEGRVGSAETLALLGSGLVAAAAWGLQQRERRRSDVRGRGLLRKYLEVGRAWVELVDLWARCTRIERLRERTVRWLRARRRRSPFVGGAPWVCIVAENGARGGTEAHTLALVERLVANGFRVEYVSTRTDLFDDRIETLGAGNVRVVRSPLSVFDERADARQQWLRQLDGLRSRMLLLPKPFVQFGGFPFLRACRRTFGWMVYIEHALPRPMPPRARKRYLGGRIPGLGIAWHKERLRRRFRFRCAHRVIAVSDAVRRQLVESWTCPPEKIVTVHGGVDWRLFQASGDERARARRVHGLPADAFVFGMLTRLSPEKGVDIAIEAFRRLLEVEPGRPAYLVIAGDGPEARALEDFVARYGLEDRVLFTGFARRPEDVLSLMDAVVFSSREEGLPIALLEGMAAGALPIVARVGGMPEVVDDPELGWVVEPGDAAGLARAMAEAAALDAAAIARRRERVLRRVQTGFDGRTSYQNLLSVLGLAPSEAGETVPRGPLRACREAAASWVEFARLWMRCTPIESLREGAARLLAGDGRASPSRNGRRPVCIVEESCGWGGAETHTRQLIEHLLAEGHDVEYVSGKTNVHLDEMKEFDPSRVRIVSADASIFNNTRETQEEWLRLFRQLHSRVLLFPTLDVEFGNAAFLRACRRVFDRVVYIEHTLPPSLPRKTRNWHLGGRIPGPGLWWHKERLRRRFRSRCAHRVVSVSEAVRQKFIAEWDCDAEKIVTIPNGIDWRRFRVDDESRRAARQAHGLPPDAFVFGMLIRLSREKGADLAVEAYGRLVATGTARETRLVIAGDGPDMQALKDLAVQCGVDDRVLFTGFVERPVEVLPLMDAIVFSSRQEGLPLALLEGMAAGALPIVTRVGGMPEVVDDPALGWVVEPGDIAELARAMADAAALDPPAVTAKRERVLERVRTGFDARTTYARILEVAGLGAG